MQTLSEYVDDTEDFINIALDSHRNQLIRLDIVLTTFTTSMALITGITSLFAMNVALSPNAEEGAKGPYSWFVAIVASCAAGAVALMTGVLAYCKWRKLLMF